MSRTMDWSRAPQVVVFAAVLLLSAGAQQLHRWVDSEGNVHYSDQPPPANARDIKTISGSGTRTNNKSEDSDEVEDAPSYVDQEAEFQERQVMKAEAEAKERQAEEEAAEKKRNCSAARGQVQTLNAGGRITRRNDEGEVEFLDDKLIAKELEHANKMVKQWCES